MSINTTEPQTNDPSSMPLDLALKRRLAWNIPIGIFWLLAALPLPAAEGSESAATSFDWVAAALGIALVAESIVVRVRPHRALFLVDAGWFAIAAAWVLYQLLSGGSWLWWLPVFGLHVGNAVGGFKQYQHFGPQESGTLGLRL